jgi:hypothetical protein
VVDRRLTIDHAMLLHFLIIGFKGLRRDAVETPISNAGVGSLPKMMIIALHPVHGLRWWWSVSGAPWARRMPTTQLRC